MGKRPLFTLGGIPVRVQPWFFAMILFLGSLYLSVGWAFVASWVVIATASILVHEYGHALAFRYYGLRPSITLHGMGGLTAASTGDVGGADEFTPTRSIITSLAGPLSALVLIGVPSLLYARNLGYDPGLILSTRRLSISPTEIILEQLVFINVGWSLLNLIPVLPLDGGNVVASIGEIFSPRHGRRIANIASIVLAVLFALWGFGMGIIFAPIFAAMFIGMNVVELTNSRNDDADRELAAATRSLIEYNPMQAEQLTWSVLTQSPSGERLRWATELTAWARMARGDINGAHAAVMSMAPPAGPSASMRGALALASGNQPEGVAMLAWAFVNDEHKSAKVLGAMAAAQSGQVVAVAHELVRMGSDGAQAALLFRDLLEYVGHHDEARQVDGVLNATAPRPPGR